MDYENRENFNKKDVIEFASEEYNKQQENYKKSYFCNINIEEVKGNDELKKEVVDKVRKFDIQNRYDVEKINDFLEAGIITMDDIVTGMENGSRGTQSIIDVMPVNMLNKLDQANYIKKDGEKINYRAFLDEQIKAEEQVDYGEGLGLYKLGRIARSSKAKDGYIPPEIVNKINKEVKELLAGEDVGAANLMRMSSDGRDLRILFENGVVSDEQAKKIVKHIITELKDKNEKLLSDVVKVSKEAVRLGYVSDKEVEEWLK